MIPYFNILHRSTVNENASSFPESYSKQTVRYTTEGRFGSSVVILEGSPLPLVDRDLNPIVITRSHSFSSN